MANPANQRRHRSARHELPPPVFDTAAPALKPPVLVTALAVGCALLLSACGTAPGMDEGSTGGTPPTVVTGTGTVQAGVEGGCWLLVSDQGPEYNPLTLPPAYQVPGMGVSFQARVLMDVVSACMQGILVELISIEPAP